MSTTIEERLAALEQRVAALEVTEGEWRDIPLDQLAQCGQPGYVRWRRYLEKLSEAGFCDPAIRTVGDFAEAMLAGRWCALWRQSFGPTAEKALVMAVVAAMAERLDDAESRIDAFMCPQGDPQRAEEA